MRLSGLFLMIAYIFLAACSSDEDSVEQPVKLEISSFSFDQFNPIVIAEINQETKVINAIVPFDADLKSLAPSVVATQGATITPPPGFIYDFSNGLDFKITLGQEVKTYSVTVVLGTSPQNQILNFEIPEYNKNTEIDGLNIKLTVAYGVDITQVKPIITISPKSTVSPASGAEVDLSNPVTYTVTAENGEKKEFIVTANVEDPETAIRAFWVPDPSHTNFLRSYADIQSGVDLAAELNFNVIYVCVWAKTRTLYPSQVLADNSSYVTPQEALFHNYTGGTGDALADLITVAHAKDIKVILWYEYGFMSRWGSAPTPSNDKILEVHPDWVGINNNGTETNYNGTDFYYNAYHPDVQQFMLDLMMEAVSKYDIDGIQGDDRLPAMPRNSGYDSYTIEKYKTEKGKDAPSDYNNVEWVRFRADILNSFAKEMYTTVKAAKPDCIVGFSPNPYPWAFQNLMQEWPVWLDEGLVQILSVQCYRSNVASYGWTIDEVLTYFNAHGDGNLERLSPGIILKGSSGLADPEVLRGQMQANRDRGIMGESFFYDVPLKNDDFKQVIKSFYKHKARFPEL